MAWTAATAWPNAAGECWDSFRAAWTPFTHSTVLAIDGLVQVGFIKLGAPPSQGQPADLSNARAVAEEPRRLSGIAPEHPNVDGVAPDVHAGDGLLEARVIAEQAARWLFHDPPRTACLEHVEEEDHAADHHMSIGNGRHCYVA